MFDLSIIVAHDKNRAIGRKGTIPWHMPSDLRYFQRATDGAVCIMGRKTWESLPAASRPLRGRINVVVTRNPRYTARGALVLPSLHKALEVTDGVARQFVIGGAGLYAEALPLAQSLYVTEVQTAYPGMDTFFPAIPDESDWAVLSSHYSREPGDNHEKRVVEMTRRHNLVDLDGVRRAAEAAVHLSLFAPSTHLGCSA